MPEMMASHFLASSAAMIPSKPVLSNRAFTPMRRAMSVPMSMSEPSGVVVPGLYDSSGGYVMSLQKTSAPALLIEAGAWIEEPPADVVVAVVAALFLPPPQPAARRATRRMTAPANAVSFERDTVGL